jgi:hypothetical protein
MTHRKKLPRAVLVAVVISMPLLVTACGSPVLTQSEQQKPSAGDAGVTLVLGARKVPPPTPPKAPPRSPHTTPAFYYEPVGPFLLLCRNFDQLEPQPVRRPFNGAVC